MLSMLLNYANEYMLFTTSRIDYQRFALPLQSKENTHGTIQEDKRDHLQKRVDTRRNKTQDFTLFQPKGAKIMEQYRILAECLLPEHMLDWFELKNVQVETKGEAQVVHLYLDENEQKPDAREDLRPNGFTRESVFHDFPIRGHEVLLHVRRRRWLDADGHNVMTECHFIQESTRCSTELAAFLKEAFGNAPYNGPFV